MRRLSVFIAVLTGAAALLAISAPPAGAYGGGAGHEMWQIGLSFNCNSPTACDQFGGTGGFWGWAEFDRDGSATWGDAEFAGCGHTVGGVGGPGGAGAGHISIEIESWRIAPGSAGPQTFYGNGEETDFRPHGVKVTRHFHGDSGIPATPGHYSTADVFGFTFPGLAVQIQVAYRPAK